MMKAFYYSILLFALVMALPFQVQPLRAAEMGIAVVVNDDAISLGDLNDRMRLIMVSSQLPNTEQTQLRLAPQVISNLVEEQLKLQEAGRLELEVTQSEINSGFATIAQQNNMEPDQFRAMLKNDKINLATMERQIRSQIAWAKVVQKELRPQVIITDADVDAVLESLQNSAGKQEYLLSEILLPVNEPADESKVQGFAQEMVQQIRAEKAPFFRMAQQFSKAAGAAEGGSLGWIQQGNLEPDLERVVASMEKGQVSEPVRSLSGYHIFLMREKRTISGETLPTREQVFQTLGEQRLDRLQRRHLQELQASAYIENRLGS